MSDQTDDTGSRLSVRIGAYFVYALIVLAGFALWWVGDYLGPPLFERVAAILASTSLSATSQAAVLFAAFMFVPWGGSLLVFWATRHVEADGGWIVRGISVAAAAAFTPSVDEANSTLAPQVALSFSHIVNLVTLAIALGFGAWLLFKVARWLIRDERTARAQAK